MTATDLVFPSLMEQPTILKHSRFVRVRQRSQGATADMGVRTKALVPARSDFPSRLADAEGKIGFVPLCRHKRLIEQPDPFEALASDDPGADDTVDFLNPKPVPRKRTDRAPQSTPVLQVFPTFDWIINGKHVEPAAQSKK